MRILLPVLLLLVAACDSRDPETSWFGRFDADLRGSLDRDLEGNATFQVASLGDPDIEVLSITLTDRQQRGRFIGVTDYQGVLSTPGTYEIAGSRIEGPTVLYVDQLGDFDAVLSAAEGTVRITVSTDDRVEGVIEARMERRGGTGATDVSARFEAVRLDPPSL